MSLFSLLYVNILLNNLFCYSLLLYIIYYHSPGAQEEAHRGDRGPQAGPGRPRERDGCSPSNKQIYMISHMFIYVTCMCVYIYIYIYIYIYMCLECNHMYMYMYMHMYMYVYMYMYMYMYMCMCTCVCVYIYPCVYIYIYIYIYETVNVIICFSRERDGRSPRETRVNAIIPASGGKTLLRRRRHVGRLLNKNTTPGTG